MPPAEDELDPELAADLHEVREVFLKLRKGLKQIQLYRHNVERYEDYLSDAHQALSVFLDRKFTLQLRLTAMSYKYKNHIVFEDDSREGNLIFNFWQVGVRLFIFKQGLGVDELLRFLLLVIGDPRERNKPKEDLVTRLWKEEFETIEYVVVESFQSMPDDEPEEVEMEIEKVVAYLYKQLQSNSEDYLRYARISLEDLDLELDGVDQVRGVIVKALGADAADQLRIQKLIENEEHESVAKLVVILFQVLELDTTQANFQDVAEAFIQLLDALLYQEKFNEIFQILKRFEISANKPSATPESKALILQCGERFGARMGDSHRLQTIAHVLNNGLAKNPDALKAYLSTLGADAVPALLDMLETLELPKNRRLVCEVLIELGTDRVGAFTTRLTHPSSNMVKDMLFIIDALDPPEKFGLFTHVLKHPNTVLRLETLAIIGRNRSEECFETIKDVFTESADSQMRAQAARLLPFHESLKSAPLLLVAANDEEFDKRTDVEKKSIYQALGQVGTLETTNFLTNVLAQKTGIFGRKRVEELKSLAISGLEAAPSVPTLKTLAGIAQDSKHFSDELCAQARQAAIKMKSRLLGKG